MRLLQQLLCVLLSTCTVSTAAHPISTSTGLGAVIGECEEHVCKWLNIPFADKFVRFSPSQPRSEPYKGVGGTTYGPGCFQFMRQDVPHAPLPQSEDCLSLNIWAPTTAREVRRPTELLPVMVWIHGGGFVGGSARDADQKGYGSYDGARLAANGVVVVTLQYRLGIFGFFQSSDGTGGANGLGDQITALQWVKQHIQHFGGDSTQVTIFGESSGSVSVCTLMHLPQAAGLFIQAITQSGACLPSIDLIASTRDAAASRKAYLKRLPATEASLRTMDAHKLVNLTLELYDLTDIFFTAAPSVDGHILPDFPLNLRPLPVSAMVGMTSYDNPEVPNIPGGAAAYFSQFIPSAPTILAKYPAHTRDRDIVSDACLRCADNLVLQNHICMPPNCLDGLRCQVASLARRIKTHHGESSVFAFVYDFPHDDALHGSDVLAVFGSFDPTSHSPGMPTPPQGLVNLVQHTWVSFAKTGRVGWPEVDSAQPVRAQVLGEAPTLLQIESTACTNWTEALNKAGPMQAARMCWFGAGGV